MTIGESILVPARMIFLMWVFFCVEFILDMDFGWLGVQPREIEGLIGLLTAPLVHGNLRHLVSNTLPLLFLGTLLYYFYPKKAGIVFTACYVLSSLLVWLFAATGPTHVGASGLIYGLASFLVFYGIFSREFKAILLSIVVIVFYGSLIYGILPQKGPISWEAHLAGSVVGLGAAFLLRGRSSDNSSSDSQTSV